MVRAVTDALAALEPLRGRLSAVALDPEVAVSPSALARLGAARVVRPGELQQAPPEWFHDGRRPLVHLVRWLTG